MKSIFFLIFIVPVFISSQKNAFRTLEINLNFEFFKKDLNYEVKAQIDSIWDLMKNGSTAEFNLCSKLEQKKLKEDHLHKLTIMRADSVLAYLHRKRIHPKYTSTKIAYFERFQRSQCTASNASYREFTKSKKGRTSVLLEKDAYSRKYYHRSDSLLLTQTCNTYMLNNSTDNWITGEQGTMVMFPERCFSSLTSEQITEIEILLCEYYTLEDLLLSGLTTSSAENIIETGGTVFIEARHKGKKLHLKTDHPIKIFFPSNEKLKNGMKTFDGGGKDGLINWKENTQGNVKKIKEGSFLSKDTMDSTNYDNEMEWEGEGEFSEGYYAEMDGYLMTTNKIGWINCDRFYDTPNKTDLLVQCNTKDKMCYRLVFENIKSILPGYEYSPEGKMKFANVPKGEKAIVLAYLISKDKKIAKFAVQEVVIGRDYEITLNPSEISIDNLKSELNQLF